MGNQRADSRRGGRRSGAEKKSDENSGRVGTHHPLFTRETRSHWETNLKKTLYGNNIPAISSLLICKGALRIFYGEQGRRMKIRNVHPPTLFTVLKFPDPVFDRYSASHAPILESRNCDIIPRKDFG
ncbi:hypothetical protein TNCV_3664301 [Trichonephila clavipes]|nr:hypothetical protein TNCV_3664301 [Trichonephila clavipes]